MKNSVAAVFFILLFAAGCKNLIAPKMLNENSFYSPGLEVLPGETYHISNLKGALCLALVNVSHSQLFSTTPEALGLDGASEATENSTSQAEGFAESRLPESGSAQSRAILAKPPKSLLDCVRLQLEEDKNGFRSEQFASPRAENFAVGQRRTFWASSSSEKNGYSPVTNPNDIFYDEENVYFKEVPAVCRAVSDHAAIFVGQDEFNSESEKAAVEKDDFAIAKEIASAVDIFFDAEVSLLGSPFFYESTGGSSKLVIFLYNIADSNVIGYFSPKDYYERAVTSHSNFLEMFYLDTRWAVESKDVALSTLIHEFQHMVLFHQKQVKGNVINIDIWFNEMLSLMAEDILYPFFKSARDGNFDDKNDSGWMPNMRGPTFLNYYNKVGVSYNEDGAIETYLYYSPLGIFGSYLLRNYGGARLLHELVCNGYQGIEGIGQAVAAIYPKRYANSQGVFEDLLTKFPEIFLTQTAKSPIDFCSVKESAVSEFAGFSYRLYGFDIWDNARWKALYETLDEKVPQLFEGNGLLTIPARCFQLMVLLDDSHRGESLAIKIPNQTGTGGSGQLRCFLYCAEQPTVSGKYKKKQWNK